MAAVYAALVGKLSGAAKDHLVKDQVRWIGDRNRACVGDKDGIARCLKQRYAGARRQPAGRSPTGLIPSSASRRSIKTRHSSARSPTPSTSPIRSSTARPPTSAPSMRAFADAAKKSADDATPEADRRERRSSSNGPTSRASRCTGRVPMPSPSRSHFYGYSGGAHGYGATHCTLVDLQHRQGGRLGRRLRRGRRMAAGPDDPDRRRRSQEAVRRTSPASTTRSSRPTWPSCCAMPAVYCWRAASSS